MIMEVMKENGYVDTDALLCRLKSVADNMKQARTDLDDMLAKLDGFAKKNAVSEKEGDGKTLSAEEILMQCRLENNILKLPGIQFDKKSYAKVKQIIENAGGSWKGGKVQGFTFSFDAQRVFEILKQGKSINLQKEYQFFETPDNIADWLIGLAGGIQPEDTVLEPSAGRGALIRAIHRAAPNVMANYVELMPENLELLEKLKNINFLHYDFEKLNTGLKYSKIIANPPFANNQDMQHIKKMYAHLTEGGTLASIAGLNWTFAKTKQATEFREWLQKVNAETHQIPKGAFKTSGTTIPATAIIIHK
jgi:hypothetical protein